MTEVYITGTGVFTPPETITNDELVACFNQYVAEHNKNITNPDDMLKESSSAFIEKASGIKSRYVLEKSGVLDLNRMRPWLKKRKDDELSLQAEISLVAARQALDYAEVDSTEVDGIIVACSNFQRPYPAMAIEIQNELKAKGYGLDMNVACSSATFGITMAYNAIKNKQNKCMLVISPEIASGGIDYKDRDSHFIFGDVAVCSVIQAADNIKTQKPKYKIIDSKLATSFSNNIRSNFGYLNYAEVESNDQVNPVHFNQNGRKVFKEVVPMVCEHILTQLQQLNISQDQIKKLWLHQANKNMNDLIAKKIMGHECDNTIAPIVLDRYANTGSAGSILALHESFEDLKPFDLGILSSFGAGYSIGSLLLERG